MVYYGPGLADVAAGVAAVFGLPRPSVQQVTGVQGVQFHAGEDFATGTKPVPTAQAPGNAIQGPLPG
jgi:hypothetical protein